MNTTMKFGSILENYNEDDNLSAQDKAKQTTLSFKEVEITDDTNSKFNITPKD